MDKSDPTTPSGAKGLEQSDFERPTGPVALVNGLPHILDSAVILALLSGIAYYFGRKYYEGFLGTFGIQADGAGLSTAAYIVAAFDALIPVLLMLVAVLPREMFPRFALKPTGFFMAFAQNLVLAGAALWYSITFDLFQTWDVVKFVLLVCGIAALLALPRFSITHTFFSSSWVIKLIVVWSLFSLLGSVATYSGRQDALGLISGNSPRTQIVIETNEDSSISSVPLILVFQANGFFYLSPQQGTQVDTPIVFIVPESQLKSAIVARIP